MRLVFMGTPDFAVPVLQAFLAAGDEIAAVYTQPPRPAGRGYKLTPSPVQACAEAAGLPVRYPTSLKTPEAQAEFAALNVDAAVVVAYGLLLPAPILAAPRLGCFNLHASLLPRWRGAAPIQRAILAGDAETGVCAMQMDIGLDTGPVLARETVAIGPRMTVSELHDALAAIGAPLMLRALHQHAAGHLLPVPQAAEGVTYAAKLKSEESRLDWTQPAAMLDRQIRAFNPGIGTWCDWEGERLKILAAEPVSQQGEPGVALPGVALDDKGLIGCGQGALRLLRVQRAGKPALDIAALLNGKPLPAGTRLG